ncbi:MAG: carbohydrate ABC transporter permease [Acidimicrobiia bacterium]|nr:carbohydrate ABC transporter permease [Acidimicrobiia bacterium]
MTATSVTEARSSSNTLARNRKLRRWSFRGFLALAALIWIIPLIWMLSLSLSDNNALQRSTSSLLPVEPTLDNFTTLFESGSTPRWLWNSIVVTVATTVLTLILSSMAGYAFARIPFRGKRIAFPLVLAGLMVPKEAMFIPLFLIFADFQQHNTYHALVLPRIAAPLGVFIMTQFFLAIPGELEEAAVIDGASRWTIFRRIMLPMSVPALTALGIFTFVLTWNDFLWPLVSATDPDNFTITTGLASRQGNFAQANALGDLMAQGVFASAPLLILFFIFQRQVIRGISLGSGTK